MTNAITSNPLIRAAKPRAPGAAADADAAVAAAVADVVACAVASGVTAEGAELFGVPEAEGVCPNGPRPLPKPNRPLAGNGFVVFMSVVRLADKFASS